MNVFWLTLLLPAAGFFGLMIGCLAGANRLSEANEQAALWKREARKQEELALFWQAEAERREAAHG